MKDRPLVFERVANLLQQSGFTIVGTDDSRPWGGFYVIDEEQAAKFARHFFPEEQLDKLRITNRLSPKILIVAPNHRLSWQYHNRRAEIWKCIDGTVAVMTSNTDDEDVRHNLKGGDIIKLKQGERHRLIGLEDWGIVAEIWQHTDESNPSDENDIVRLQDDYSRN